MRLSGPTSGEGGREEERILRVELESVRDLHCIATRNLRGQAAGAARCERFVWGELHEKRAGRVLRGGVVRDLPRSSRDELDVTFLHRI